MNMAKRITISITDESAKWLKENFVNVSSFVNALITKHIGMKSAENHTINTDFGVPKDDK